MTRTTTKIITCSHCQGVGSVLIKYYKSTREPAPAPCSICKGEGRLQRTVTIRTEPLKSIVTPLKEVYHDEYDV